MASEDTDFLEGLTSTSETPVPLAPGQDSSILTEQDQPIDFEVGQEVDRLKKIAARNAGIDPSRISGKLLDSINVKATDNISKKLEKEAVRNKIELEKKSTEVSRVTSKKLESDMRMAKALVAAGKEVPERLQRRVAELEQNEASRSIANPGDFAQPAKAKQDPVLVSQQNQALSLNSAGMKIQQGIALEALGQAEELNQDISALNEAERVFEQRLDQQEQRSQERISRERRELSKLEETFKELGGAKVDPNNFWKSRSTGQKIALGIGVFLSGLSGGQNNALKIIDNAINRDIQAQKDDFRRQGESARNTYSLMVKKFGSEEKAEQASLAMAYKNFQLKASMMGKRHSSKKIQGNALKLMGETQLKINDFASKMAKISGGAVAPARGLVEADQVRSEDERKRYVPLLKQMALTEKDAKELKEQSTAKIDADTLLTRAIQHRKQHGAEFLDRGAIAQGQSIHQSLVLKVKELGKLGVLSKDDMGIINGMIGESLDSVGFVLPKLLEVKNFIKSKWESTVKGRGLQTISEKANLGLEDN